MPLGATTLVYGSALNEQLRGSSCVLNAQSQSTNAVGLFVSDVETEDSVGKFGIPCDANDSIRYVERSG